MSLKGIINNVTATSTHIHTNFRKTSNTALQDQEQTASCMIWTNCQKDQRRKWYANKTAGNDQKQTTSRKCIYNHDTAVNTLRQSLLLIMQKLLELIPEAKAVKCTSNPSEAVLARKTPIKPKTREKEQPKATLSN